GEEYVEQNGSYGLATLCKEHVTLEGGNAVTFDYPAKSGKRRVQTIVDEDVFAVVQSLKRRRTGGLELFAYREKGRWMDVHAAEPAAAAARVLLTPPPRVRSRATRCCGRGRPGSGGRRETPPHAGTAGSRRPPAAVRRRG